MNKNLRTIWTFLAVFLVILVLNILMAWTLWNEYDLDPLFALGAFLTLALIPIWVAAIMVFYTTYKAGTAGKSLKETRLDNTIGKCFVCDFEGKVYFPKGLNLSSLYRCPEHIESLL